MSGYASASGPSSQLASEQGYVEPEDYARNRNDFINNLRAFRYEPGALPILDALDARLAATTTPLVKVNRYNEDVSPRANLQEQMEVVKSFQDEAIKRYHRAQRKLVTSQASSNVESNQARKQNYIQEVARHKEDAEKHQAHMVHYQEESILMEQLVRLRWLCAIAVKCCANQNVDEFHLD